MTYFLKKNENQQIIGFNYFKNFKETVNCMINK